MLKLVRMSGEYKDQLFEMMDEWTGSEEKIVPYSIRKNDYRDFDFYLEHLDVNEEEADKTGLVPDVTFFLYDTERDRLLGAVNIRKRLNQKLLLTGGHIGDGIRPSERGKGYGTKLVGFALDECRKMGMERVLMTCDRSNAASARTIIKNGGVLENEVTAPDEEDIVQRYWIKL